MSWFTEQVSPTFEVRLKIKKKLYDENSRCQRIEIVETYDFGRILILDGCIQLSTKDYSLYHVAVVEKSFDLLSKAARVLIVGGGDGALLTEVLGRPSVQLARLVEIDDQVICCCQRFFARFRSGFSDSRADVIIDDGARYVNRVSENFDLIIVDAPDPEGPGARLFRASFFANWAKLLNPGGVLAAQSESPYLFPRISCRVCRNFEKLFARVEQTAVVVPSCPGGSVGFTFGVKEK